ncbi:MAG TPA: hypothetical protein VE912_23200 [Bacteroidales bacterium]|nr:hypothetical protein [Bacteroidales bacterium]
MIESVTGHWSLVAGSWEKMEDLNKKVVSLEDEDTIDCYWLLVSCCW